MGLCGLDVVEHPPAASTRNGGLTWRDISLHSYRSPAQAHGVRHVVLPRRQNEHRSRVELGGSLEHSPRNPRIVQHDPVAVHVQIRYEIRLG